MKAITIVCMKNILKNNNKPHQRVPNALKQNVWLRYNGEKFNSKCAVTWCKNIITPFTFEAGHDVPSSKGGSTTLDNLLPICSSCNKSMGNMYTIQEFSQKFSAGTQDPKHSKDPKDPKKRIGFFTCCSSVIPEESDSE